MRSRASGMSVLPLLLIHLTDSFLEGIERCAKNMKMRKNYLMPSFNLLMFNISAFNKYYRERGLYTQFIAVNFLGSNYNNQLWIQSKVSWESLRKVPKLCLKLLLDKLKVFSNKAHTPHFPNYMYPCQLIHLKVETKCSSQLIFDSCQYQLQLHILDKREQNSRQPLCLKFSFSFHRILLCSCLQSDQCLLNYFFQQYSFVRFVCQLLHQQQTTNHQIDMPAQECSQKIYCFLLGKQSVLRVALTQSSLQSSHGMYSIYCLRCQPSVFLASLLNGLDVKKE